MVACCVGLLRHQLLVSRGLLNVLSEQQLNAVLAHDGAHARRFDNLRVLIPPQRILALQEGNRPRTWLWPRRLTVVMLLLITWVTWVIAQTGFSHRLLEWLRMTG